ncbi:hypothetical protein CALCODRAFT_508347 [Calocera cornea HHB12733]|uniref:Uncharacterized protein n=1 Tax=Calocera cornea HHB12733 TaxID=1353952 RepID=A0A165GH08_9BASI|nr:hypothetical protein CALCODRAFT_508347 [Calocera cornea HHB12733]
MATAATTLPMGTDHDFEATGQLYCDSPRWLPLGSQPQTWLRLLVVRDWYLIDDDTQEEIQWMDARLAGLSYRYSATGSGPLHPEAPGPWAFQQPLGPEPTRTRAPTISLCGEAFAVPYEGFQNVWNNEFFVYTALQRQMLIAQGRLIGPAPRRYPGFADAYFDLEHAGMYFRGTWITAICQIFVYLPQLRIVLMLHDPRTSGRLAFEEWKEEQTVRLTNVMVPMASAPYSFHDVHMLPPAGFIPPLVSAWYALGASHGFTRHEWMERDFPGLLLAQLVSFRGGPVEWDMSTALEGPETDWDNAEGDDVEGAQAEAE